jgi:hypothetical protein
MRSPINTNGQRSDTRWLLDQNRPTSDGKIGDQTESLQDKTGSTLKSLLRKCVGSSTPLRVALPKRRGNADARMRDLGKSEAVA